MAEDKKPDRPDTGQDEEKRPRVPLPGRWSDAMDEMIQEAMRSGEFDDLPGRGKPLKLLNNPYAPGTELAYQLLKDNNYTLPWISERQSVLADVESLRDQIRRTWQRYQAEYRVSRSQTVQLSLKVRWNQYLETWQEKIAKLNRRIAAANLKQPGEQLEIVTLTLENELGRAGAGEELG